MISYLEFIKWWILLLYYFEMIFSYRNVGICTLNEKNLNRYVSNTYVLDLMHNFSATDSLENITRNNLPVLHDEALIGDGLRAPQFS